MTANYMHHPNDFGHKVYFSAMLDLFINEAIDANTIEDYVLY